MKDLILDAKQNNINIYYREMDSDFIRVNFNGKEILIVNNCYNEQNDILRDFCFQG